ncbi:hypothetical protein NECID01_1150 [Nematocida sp. AWRm77]|nr:hypothetical protein NECID01_1150 [Nematocida sp. AWRm77]
MKYVEGMPITSLVETRGRVLVGGGGGNSAYGYPNTLYLLSSSLDILSQQVVQGLIVSVKAFGECAVLEYEHGFELFTISEDKIQGPFTLPEGSKYPVIEGEFLVYVRKNAIWKVLLADFLMGEYKESRHEMEAPAETEALCMLLKTKEGLGTLSQRGKEYVFRGDGYTDVLANEIKDYLVQKSLCYVSQAEGELSLVRMGDKKILEAKCTTVYEDVRGGCYVGTGDGYLIKYEGGVEQWRKKIFNEVPISAVTIVKQQILCSSISGRVAYVSSKVSGSFIRGATIGLLAAAAVACAKYYVKSTLWTGMSKLHSFWAEAGP